MNKLIVFDLDGTLLYTLDDLTDSVNYAMDKLGFPRYSADDVRKMIGNGVAVLMKRAVAPFDASYSERALDLQREYYFLHSDDHATPYEGIADMLASLKDRGFTVAVHTNKDEYCAKSLVAKHFGNLVDYVRGTTSSVTKPNPAKVLELMAELGVDRAHAVYCGDSDVDILTAKNADIPCISVLWGFRGREFLSEHGAERFAEKASDVVTEACAAVSEQRSA